MSQLISPIARIHASSRRDFLDTSLRLSARYTRDRGGTWSNERDETVIREAQE